MPLQNFDQVPSVYQSKNFLENKYTSNAVNHQRPPKSANPNISTSSGHMSFSNMFSPARHDNSVVTYQTARD
jgi:hypothetical protein